MWRASEINHTRQIRGVPPRGQIEDRAGVVLATNRNQIVVSVVPEELQKNKGVLPKLAALLRRPKAVLAEAIEAAKTTMFEPARVVAGVDMDIATHVEEHRADLPGDTVGAEPIRR